jgi:tRNA(fMet)-specific endonuclease VapC
MKRWLVDTNTCIVLVNQQAHFLKVARHLDGVERAQVFVSAVTAAELRFGVARSAQRASNEAKLERFLAEFEVAPFDAEAARVYGDVRAELANRGTPISPLDTMIAAHGLALAATVVTNNTREFRRVPKLKVVDWLR